MVQRILLFGGLLLSALPLWSQPPDFDMPPPDEPGMIPSKKRSGGYGYFSMGYQSMNVQALNERFNAAGFPSMNSLGVSTGGGGIAVINRIVVGGEGWAMNAGDVTSNGYTSTLSGGGGVGQIGYMFGNKKMSFYPLIGFGGAATSVNIRPDGGSLTFDSLLARPGQGVEISGVSAVATFSLNSEFRLGRAPLYLFGWQAGWIQGLGKTTWNAQKTTLTNGPDLRMQGWYVRLKIGAGIY